MAVSSQFSAVENIQALTSADVIQVLEQRAPGHRKSRHLWIPVLPGASTFQGLSQPGTN
jgi:hypothetical protein